MHSNLWLFKDALRIAMTGFAMQNPIFAYWLTLLISSRASRHILHSQSKSALQ